MASGGGFCFWTCILLGAISSLPEVPLSTSSGERMISSSGSLSLRSMLCLNFESASSGGSNSLPIECICAAAIARKTSGGGSIDCPRAWRVVGDWLKGTIMKQVQLLASPVDVEFQQHEAEL